MGDASTKDNLARIRDNQRRSRARRKEYLQELEEKFRSCEQQGVQASTEVQQAAKRVLDENKRLRALLQQKGVSDAEINSFVTPDPSESLNTMLNNRRPCGTKASCCSSSSRNPIQQGPMATPLPSANGEAPALRPPPPQQLTVETVSINSALTAPDTTTSFMSTAEFSTSNPGSVAGAFDPSYAYYNMPMQSSWAYPPMDIPTQSPNMSSCIDAANIIRGMRDDVGPELEQDLGCSDSTQDCKVDNNVVFELVDKYSMHDS